MNDCEPLTKELRAKLEQAEARLRDIEGRYQHLVEETHGLICTHDLDGILLSINPAACDALGYRCDEMIGRNLRDFLSPDRQPYFQIFLDRINLNTVDKGTLLLTARDGRELTFQYHNIKITHNVEKPYVLGHAYDITEVTELQRQLVELTVTDDLTGLTNRRGFIHRATERMKVARRTGERLVVIFADIDGLKKVNDTLGHEVGSEMIVDTAELLRDSFRQTDILARWGGDEFVVLMGRVTKLSPEVVVARFRKKLASLNKRAHRPYNLSVSLGLAPVDLRSGASLYEIIDEADKEMYKKKRARAGLTDTPAKMEAMLTT